MSEVPLKSRVLPLEPATGARCYRKILSIQKRASNEVYCTHAPLLLIKIMLFSKFHCQIFYFKIFSCKVPATISSSSKSRSNASSTT